MKFNILVERTLRNLNRSIFEDTASKRHGVETDDSVVGILSKYSKLPDSEKYLTRYTDDFKIGINPKFNNETPFGIYFYPLMPYWEEFKEEGYDADNPGDSLFKSVLPDFINRKYIQICKIKPNINFYNIDSEEDFELDSQPFLRRHGNVNQTVVQKVLSLFPDDSSREKSLSDIFKKLKEQFSINLNSINSNNIDFKVVYVMLREIALSKTTNRKSAMIMWAKLLKEVLNIDGIVDSGNTGIIDNNPFDMPSQAVVFDAASIELVETIMNKEKDKNKDSIERASKFKSARPTKIQQRPGQLNLPEQDALTWEQLKTATRAIRAETLKDGALAERFQLIIDKLKLKIDGKQLANDIKNSINSVLNQEDDPGFYKNFNPSYDIDGPKYKYEAKYVYALYKLNFLKPT